MDTRSDTNAPVDTLRDGRLKATIWENKNTDGDTYHTVTLAKTYEDRNGNLQDSHSLSSGEALRGAELLREAHGVVRGIQRERAQERRADRQTERGPAQPAREDRPSRFRRSGPGMER